MTNHFFLVLASNISRARYYDLARFCTSSEQSSKFKFFFFCYLRSSCFSSISFSVDSLRAKPTYFATFSIFFLWSLTTPISKKSKYSLCLFNDSM